MAKKIAPGEWSVDKPIEGYRYLLHGTRSKFGFTLNHIIDESWCEVTINKYINDFGDGGTFLVKLDLLRHLHFESKIPKSENNKNKKIFDIIREDFKYIEWCIDNYNDFHLEEEEIAFLQEIEQNLFISSEARKKNKNRLEKRRRMEEEAAERKYLREEEEFEMQKNYNLDDYTNSSNDNPWKEALGDDEEANDAYWNTE